MQRPVTSHRGMGGRGIIPLLRGLGRKVPHLPCPQVWQRPASRTESGALICMHPADQPFIMAKDSKFNSWKAMRGSLVSTKRITSHTSAA